MSYKAKKFIKRVDINSEQVKAIQLKIATYLEDFEAVNRWITEVYSNLCFNLNYNIDENYYIISYICTYKFKSIIVYPTDWLVVDSSGRMLYPIKDQKFKQLYSLIADDLYSRNVEMVEAIRFNSYDDRFSIKDFVGDALFYGIYEGDPDGVHKHRKYKPNSSFCSMKGERDITKPRYFDNECYIKSNNYERIAIGNWVIKRPNGNIFTLSDKQFNLQYTERETRTY